VVCLFTSYVLLVFIKPTNREMSSLSWPGFIGTCQVELANPWKSRVKHRFV